MTPEELKEIKERAEKATPGPWTEDDGAVCCGDGFGFSSIPAQYCSILNYEHGLDLPEHISADYDAEFIAHARTDIPKLIEALEIAMEALRNVMNANWRTNDKATNQRLNGWINYHFLSVAKDALKKIGRV